MVSAAPNMDGIAVALVTPWRDGAIDAAAFERVVRRACAAGVVAVCPAGTTGEGPRLTPAQRLDLVRRAAATATGGVAVIGAAAAASIDETVAELAAQAAAGADAALLTPPSRLPLGADGCRAFFTAVADRSPLPLVLYHIPAFTGVHLAPEVVLDLAGHPAIVGLKDSAADLQYHLRVADGLHAAGDAEFALLTGTDALMVASLLGGGRGAVLASGNVVPHLGVAVHRAVRAGDLPTALELQRRLYAIVLACRRGQLPAGWKAAVALLDDGGRDAVPPGETLDDAATAALAADLRALGVLP